MEPAGSADVTALLRAWGNGVWKWALANCGWICGGNRRATTDVKIDGGVGQATVYLPRDAYIVANAHGGIGNIDVRGLEKQGERWINPSHEQAPATINVEVNGGIGQITLIVE